MVIETDSPPQRMVTTAWRDSVVSFSASVTVIVCLPASPEVGLMEIQLSARETSRADAVQLWVVSKPMVWDGASAEIEADKSSCGIRMF